MPYRSSSEKSTIDDIVETQAPSDDEQVNHTQSTHLSTGKSAAALSAKVDSPSPRLDNHHLLSVGNSALCKSALQQCVNEELTKYFATLEGHAPQGLYRMVMSQVEAAVIDYVLDVCDDNQSRAATYLGISRGKLRSRIDELSS